METDKLIFFVSILWYFHNYGFTPFLFNCIVRSAETFFNFYCKLFHYEYGEQNNEVFYGNNKPNRFETVDVPKIELKYEDKYLNDIRKLNKKWEFTKEEIEEIVRLNKEFYDGSVKSKKETIEEITNEIIELEKEILHDIDDSKSKEDFEEYDMDGNEIIHQTLEERNEERRDKIRKLQEEYNALKREIETDEGLDNLKTEAVFQATDYIVGKKLDNLNNCYIIEKTPVGNVLMIYDKVRETFKYFADCNVPYRYLEVVGRKYVKSFNCRPVFVDMEEELKLFEEKWEREQELKKMKEEDENKLTKETVKPQQEQKKNVFTKFKSYNKDAGGKISMAPPKNSMTSKSITENKENEKILLKEKANRYTYEGKFANFNFIQKIEKKVFNKRLGLSFADFKKNLHVTK